MEQNTQERISIDMLVDNVRVGNYPDVPRSNDERITVMPETMLAHYAIIMAQCLLNNIPEENAQAIYPKRAKTYDDLMLIVNTGNLGRTNRLVAAIENLFSEAITDTEAWPSKKLASNISIFAAEFFAWDDRTRAIFFNNNRDFAPAPAAQPAEDQVMMEA